MTNYEKRVSDVKFTNHPLTLSTAEKISRHSKNSFSITPGINMSCPGATKACEGCYAQKGRHYFPNVINVQLGNYVSLLRGLLKNRNHLIKQLSDMIKGKDIFRIHESGDFFSQAYIDIWDSVIKSNKDTKFWTYTRSFMFDYSNIIKNKNFRLYASTDLYNIEEATKFAKKYKVPMAYGPIDHDSIYLKSLLKKAAICPLTNGVSYSDLRCSECKLCINGKSNVIFLKH